jgi:pimeloyl-ACP methyl ester carboxylesterase
VVTGKAGRASPVQAASEFDVGTAPVGDGHSAEQPDAGERVRGDEALGLRLVLGAGNVDPVDGAGNPTFAAFIERAGHEYRRLSATPEGYPAFVEAISAMWATQPDFTPEQLGAIAVPVRVADGDHDEAVKRSHTERIAAAIPGAGLLIQPDVSHFSFLQDPEQFTWDVLHFLEQGP